MPDNTIENFADLVAEVDDLRTNTEASLTQVNTSLTAVGTELDTLGNAELLATFINGAGQAKTITDISNYKYLIFLDFNGTDNEMSASLPTPVVELNTVKTYYFKYVAHGGNSIGITFNSNTEVSATCTTTNSCKMYGIK